MCRNIRPLHNFEPPATVDEIEAAATQFVRKVAGMTKPSAANQHVFDQAIADITASTRQMLEGLVTHAPKRDRDVERAKAKARSEKRFGTAASA